MIIRSEKTKIETSADFQSQLFGIGDLAIVFDILRSKMYSNPIESICREIGCNAVDSHREAGKRDLPIQITLPTMLDPHFKVRDFGVGLSPDRIENIYTKYAASTKRDTNDQIGSFGLGAKSFWSYTDLANVETIYNGIKYNYVCFIDETKIGKLSLLSKMATDQGNGTEVSINVKPTDFEAFRNGVYKTCKFWKVKPTIKNGNIKWDNLKPNIEGSNWFLTNGDSYYSKSMLLVDEIEYPFDYNELQGWKDKSLIDGLKGDLYLKFKTGELSLSANREAVHLDSRTQAKIIRAFNTVADELKATVQTKIDTCQSYWQACQVFQDEIKYLFRNFKFLKPITWQKNEIQYDRLYIEYNEGASFYRFDKPIGSIKNNRPYIDYSIYFNNHVLFLFNDFKEKNIKHDHLSALWKQYPDIKQIILVNTNLASDGKEITNFKKLAKKLPLELLGIKQLSSILPELPDLTIPVKAVKPRLTIFKFKDNKFKRVAIDTIDNDKNTKVVCPLAKRWSQREIKFKNKWIAPIQIEALLSRSNKVSIYGVDEQVSKERIEEVFPKAQNFEQFAETLLSKCKEAAIKAFASDNLSSYDEVDISSWRKKIDDQKSTYLKLVEAQHLINKQAIHVSSHDLNLYYQLIGYPTNDDMQKWYKEHPEFDIKNLTEQVKKKYPLLTRLGIKINKADTDIAEYINLIDKQGE
jgi:hypothetical protein